MTGSVSNNVCNDRAANENRMTFDIHTIRHIFNILASLSDEYNNICYVHMLKDKWKISTVNPERTATIEMEIPDTDFVHYDIEKSLILEMNPVYVSYILKDAKHTDTVDIRTDTTENAHRITFNIGIVNHIFRSYAQYKDRKSEISISPVHQIEINVDIKNLRDIINECLKADHIALFETKNKKICISCNNNYDHIVEGFIGKNVTKYVRTHIDLQIIKPVIDKMGNGDNDTVALYLGVNYPITMKFKISDHGTALYSVAPIMID